VEFGQAKGLQTFNYADSGTFATSEIYAVTESTIAFGWLATGDFNDDGVVDLAASGWFNIPEPDGGSAWVGGANILLGKADGGFEAALAISGGYIVNGLAPLGPVAHPRALAMANYLNGGITVYGDPSQH
jgi:hypothetical protein